MLPRSEYDAHLAAHASLQGALARRGRTYGAKVGAGIQPSKPTNSNDGNHNTPGPEVTAPPNVEVQSIQLQQGPSGTPGTIRDAEVYQALADFMAQDRTYLWFHRFSSLNIQNILNLQRKLFALDEKVKNSSKSSVHDSSSHQQYMESVQQTLHVYSAS